LYGKPKSGAIIGVNDLNKRIFGTMGVVFLQIFVALSAIPLFSVDTSAETGKLTTFSDGNSTKAMVFNDKGEDWNLAFKVLANSTVGNATFKVTGGFLGGRAYVNHTNDTGAGWGGDGQNQPDYNNTTAINQGDDLQLTLNTLGPLDARVSYGAGSKPTGVAVGDVTGDGVNETVVCNQGDTNITVYNIGTKGNLTYKATYTTSSNPWDLAIGDVSNDGRKDVVVIGGNGGTCYLDVFTQKTDGTLNSKTSYTASSSSAYAFYVKIAEVTGDTLNDVITTEFNAQYYTAGYLRVFAGNSGGTLNTSTAYSVSCNPTGVGIGDLVSSYSGKELAVYYEQSGYYPNLQVYRQSPPSLTAYCTRQLWSTTSSWNYWDPQPVECGDVNGDGKDDIVVAWTDYNGNTLGVFCQTSGGDVGTKVDYTTSVSAPRDLAIGDVNSDGKNEVLLANDGSNNFALYNQTGAGRLNSLRTYSTGNAPTGIVVADMNNDGKSDVVTAEKGADTVGVFLQKNWFNGTFISKQVTAPAPNTYANVYSARPCWNITNNGQLATVYISNNNGQTWTDINNQKGQWLNFATAGPGVWYKINMNSTVASVSPVLRDFSLEYDYGCDIKDITIDITNDGENFEFFHSGFLNGSRWVDDFSGVLNDYIQANQFAKDVNGYITIPIYFKWGGMGKLTFSDIQIKYDRPSFTPVLLEPVPKAYVGSTPVFRFVSTDADDDNLTYVLQISENSNFAPLARNLEQTCSTGGWSKTMYESGETAVYLTPGNDIFPSGKNYYWRVRAFDGILWSEYSAAQFFSIDSEPPIVSAVSPLYSASNAFTVTWNGADPQPGSGLAPGSYDVQFKMDDGQWTDWKTGTSDTSGSYTGEPGHTYYFRARASDIAGNRKIYSGGNGDTSTTIDPTAPVSTVLKLSEWQTNSKFNVEWECTDGIGGSGIASYDVQVKVGAGTWTDWLTATASTSAEFTGANGATYYFQVRAKDKAGNVEGYPGSDGDAKTRVDTSPPAGTVEDEGDETPSAIGLNIKLKFADADSGLVGYEYRVGTTSDGADIVPVTPTTQADLKIEGLNMSVGKVYYASARAKNGAGLWGPWTATNGIRVSAGGNSASVTYTNGVQNEGAMTVTMAGQAGGANVVDGDLEWRKAPYYRGELGTWSNWADSGSDGGDTGTTVFTGDRGNAYQFRYRIRTDLGVWSSYNEPTYYVRINQKPIVVMGTDMSVVVGKVIKIDASKSWDPDGDTVKDYAWDMGDGTKLTGDKVTHTYKKAGTYTVTMTLGDGSLSASGSIKVTVRKEGTGGTTPGFEALFGMAAVGAALVLMRRRK